MLNDDLALKTLIQSPKLPSIARQIDQILRTEKSSRADFYNSITEGDKAEFINGEIIFHSPVQLRHNKSANLLFRLLSSYVDIHKLGFVGSEKIMISLSRNDYEPDICFFKQETAATFTPDQMKFPAPDFIVEVLSPSTEANDRGVKLIDYAAHAIAEYWIIDPDAETVEQYQLDGDSYHLQHKLSSGIISSTAVANFTIPVRAIFNEEENLAALQTILKG